MSTIKSSSEDLTLNADGLGKDIKFQSNGVEKSSLTELLKSSKQNYVINGSYEINQENDTAATDGTYSIGDLFMYVGEASATTSLQTSSGPQGDRKFARINVDTANAQAGWYYPISNADCQDFIQDGKLSWSLSIASPSSLIGTVRMGVVKWNSTADAFTRDIVNSWGQDGTNPTLKSNLTFENTPVDVNINATFTTYTVENVTVDSDTKNILLFVWIDDGTITANDKLDVAQWQCNPGSTVKPFSSVSKATTYMDVVHYLYAPLFDDYDGQKCDFGAGLFNWSGNTMAYKQYPREMHKIPTYTGFPMNSGTPANSSIWGQAGNNAYYLTADTAGNISNKEVYRNFLGVHSNTTGFVGWIQRKGTSSNCQIILDARLGA